MAVPNVSALDVAANPARPDHSPINSVTATHTNAIAKSSRNA